MTLSRDRGCDHPRTPDTLMPPDRDGYERCRLCQRQHWRRSRERKDAKLRALLNLLYEPTPPDA